MSTSGKILLGILSGVAAGVITGILVAPASGKETRKNISEKTDDLLTNLKDFLSRENAKAEEEAKKKTEKQ